MVEIFYIFSCLFQAERKIQVADMDSLIFSTDSRKVRACIGMPAAVPALRRQKQGVGRLEASLGYMITVTNE